VDLSISDARPYPLCAFHPCPPPPHRPSPCPLDPQMSQARPRPASRSPYPPARQCCLPSKGGVGGRVSGDLDQTMFRPPPCQ
jgi:hypothetical protein